VSFRTERFFWPGRPADYQREGFHGSTNSGHQSMSDLGRFCCQSLFGVTTENFSGTLTRVARGDGAAPLTKDRVPDLDATSPVLERRLTA